MKTLVFGRSKANAGKLDIEIPARKERTDGFYVLRIAKSKDTTKRESPATAYPECYLAGVSTDGKNLSPVWTYEQRDAKRFTTKKEARAFQLHSLQIVRVKGKSSPQVVEQVDLQVAHCVHCKRIYVLDKNNGRELCDCGSELYPVTRKLRVNKELLLGDGFQAVVGEGERTT